MTHPSVVVMTNPPRSVDARWSTSSSSTARAALFRTRYVVARSSRWLTAHPTSRPLSSRTAATAATAVRCRAGSRARCTETVLSAP